MLHRESMSDRSVWSEEDMEEERAWEWRMISGEEWRRREETNVN